MNLNEGKYIHVDINSEMKKCYIDYAMSVIVGRALPDVRDGLKPVHRRILYSMQELGLEPQKGYRKCARIVGEVLGKYHPHGDSSVYDALVRMAQDFSLRYTLVDGHGNFGSVDGDSAAAMRYTEAKMNKIAVEMLRDIRKETVDFMPNFDGEEKEPVVLPSRYPNLLVNGSSGIAVGMATNIPPHNLGEIIDGTIMLIDNPETTVLELMTAIQGPDFPTGAIVMGKAGIRAAYETGKGKIVVRAKTEIEEENGRNRIVVTEIPYQVNKAKLIENIADLVKDKKITGISDLRDESDREGMRVVVEIRRDVNPNIVLNKLYKHTQLQDTFGVNMLALVKNEPKVMSLLEILTNYLDHQKDVVTRRTKYDLNKAEERAHILKGLLIALDNIDEVIKIIRGSKNVADAKEQLIVRFSLTEVQAQAIVDMRLRALTGLEREKLENEYNELMAKIAEYKAILADEKLLLGVIKKEIIEISNKYGEERRTSFEYDESEITMEDLIPNENTVIAKTSLGYIKRMTVDNFKSQNRGGRGITGMKTIEDDYIEDLLMCQTHQKILFFTNYGRVYMMKAYEIPEGSRNSRGVAIINLLQLNPGEKISAIIPFMGMEENKNLFMVTKNGIVKKTRVTEFKNIHKNGLKAINIREEDELIEVKTTDSSSEIFLVTKYGMCIRFKETNVRETGRSSMGVIGMTLDDGDEVVGMQLDSQGDSLLIVSEKGYGKRSTLDQFRLQHRGGKGLRCYKIMEKTGYIIGVKAVTDENEIMMITSGGIIIQIRMNDIRNLGRITSGVKLINLDEGVEVAKIAKVREKVSDGEQEIDTNSISESEEE